MLRPWLQKLRGRLMSKEHLKLGYNPNSGRPAGARNKLATKFLWDLLAEWEQHGAGVLRICRIERPIEFAKIVASTLPKEFTIEPSALADLSDEDLAAGLALLQRLQLNKHKEPEQPVQADEGSTKH
jgi:hypothetical protein